MEKLRQKKRQEKMDEQPLNGDFDFDLHKESNSDQEQDIFAKYDLMANINDSDDSEKEQKRGTKEEKVKLIVKKNARKSMIVQKVDEPKRISEHHSASTLVSHLDSIRDSMSLTDRLREMHDENSRFRKLLAEKDFEINYLKRKLDDEKSIMGSINGDIAGSKIIELSKKNREITAIMESEKTKNKQLTKACKDLETQLANAKEKRSRTEGQIEEEEENDSDDEPKINLSKENRELKEKLQQTTHKMMEYKSQGDILKQDNKKALKALEKEVGDNVDVKSILNGQVAWKGRQQTIRNLRSQVADLKQQVNMMDSRASQMLDEDDFDTSSMFMKEGGITKSVFIGSASTRTTNLDARHKNDLRQLEKDKKDQNEKMKKEYELIEVEFNAVKEKFEASKTRNKVLTNETKNLKEQIKTLLEKGKHDDELVEALMKKQSQLKDLVDKLTVTNSEMSKELNEKTTEGQVKSMQDKNTIDQLRLIIAEREKRVKQLENEHDYQLSSQHQNEGFSLHSSNGFSKNEHFEEIGEENIKMQTSTSRSRPESSHFNDRDISSRNSLRSAKTNGVNKLKANSANSLCAKVAFEQQRKRDIDVKLEKHELLILNKTSEVERLRLLELTKTMQKRSETLSEKLADSENRLNEQRRRGAQLEKQIERFKSTVSDGSKRQYAKAAPVSVSAVEMNQLKIEDLETTLLIQKDENDALKAALKSTLEAKEEDLRLYVEMLESTKRVFLDGIKQYKQISTEDK